MNIQTSHKLIYPSLSQLWPQKFRTTRRNDNVIEVPRARKMEYLLYLEIFLYSMAILALALHLNVALSLVFFAPPLVSALVVTVFRNTYSEYTIIDLNGRSVERVRCLGHLRLQKLLLRFEEIWAVAIDPSEKNDTIERTFYSEYPICLISGSGKKVAFVDGDGSRNNYERSLQCAERLALMFNTPLAYTPPDCYLTVKKNKDGIDCAYVPNYHVGSRGFKLALLSIILVPVAIFAGLIWAGHSPRNQVSVTGITSSAEWNHTCAVPPEVALSSRGLCIVTRVLRAMKGSYPISYGHLRKNANRRCHARIRALCATADGQRRDSYENRFRRGLLPRPDPISGPKMVQVRRLSANCQI